MSAHAPRTETELNFEAFRQHLPNLVDRYYGKYALLHSQEIKGFFDNPAEAVVEGMRRYGQGGYSVQEVTEEVESLGFYSYAGGSVQA